MEYRIEDVRIIKIAGKDRKIFKAYELIRNSCMDGFVFRGEFTAPQKTAKKNLHKYIKEENGR